MSLISEALAQRLRTLEEQKRLRGLVPQRGADSGWIDFSHNDYLNLTLDKALREITLNKCSNLPLGSTGSRLLGGEHELFSRIEKKFAQYKGCEDALYFSTGYSANEGLLSALSIIPGAHFFSDALNHASIIDGLRLAKVRGHSEVSVFLHKNLAELQKLIEASKAPHKFIVTESLFSMDGDIADLPALNTLARKQGATLIVDEAHAIGAIGPQGRGLIAEQGLEHDYLISINTCGKALGVQGAFVGGSKLLREFLINEARTFIFSTGASPWVLAALDSVLDRLPALHESRTNLAHVSKHLHQQLTAHGFELGECSHFIIPIICGSEAQALLWSERLKKHRIIARAVRPPTVPAGTSRLRLSLHAALTVADIEHLVECLVQVRTMDSEGAL